METVAFCEIEEYPRKVLAKHWPDIPIYNDVRTLTKERLDADGIGPIDLICGGYPCQPYSKAGNRNGEEDDRALWPEVNRLISEYKPDWFIGENVDGHVSMGLDQVLSDLEGKGYTWEAFIIPACAIDAQHRRDRVWIIANSNGQGLQKRLLQQGIQGIKRWDDYGENTSMGSGWSSGPRLVRRGHGISSRVDRIRGLGNAVVPQIPEIIGRAILKIRGDI